MTLDTFFSLRERKTTVAREFRGAVATFLTMAYILVANPVILQGAGVPFAPAVAATALAAGVCCLIMGFYANFPIALASGMGLNAIVAGSLAAATGSWQTAMGLVVLDGILALLLVLIGLREAIMRAIPHDLRLAIGAGIGLFITLIGLANAHFIRVPMDPPDFLQRAPGSAMPPLAAGDFTAKPTLVAAIALLVAAVLFARRVKGSLIIGILAGTAAAWAFGLLQPLNAFQLPSFETLFQADVRGALRWEYLPLLLSILMVDFFDTLGTATAVAEEADLMDRSGRIPRLRQLLISDSLAASIGGMMGVSSVTSYIESASGVAEGARTGLHTVFVGLFFFAAVFAAPALAIIPAEATAAALVLVGFLMVTHMAKIDAADWTTAVPAFLIFVTVPLTYSIAHGIGIGFVAYVLIQLAHGRWRSVHPLMYVCAAALGVFLAYGG
jgi:AGZA family xanthine/uracil permease-like MFS transporter